MLKLKLKPEGIFCPEYCKVSEQAEVNTNETGEIDEDADTVCEAAPFVTTVTPQLVLLVTADNMVISPLYEAEAVPVELTALTV